MSTNTNDQFDETKLTSYLEKMLEAAFIKYDGELGAQFLGDWMVIAEVQTSEGPTLRIISGDDVPMWRQMGMLKFTSGDLGHDLLVYRLRTAEED